MQKLIVLIIISFSLTGCWDYGLDQYLIISNYSSQTPKVYDLTSGRMYGLKDSLIRRKEYPFFRTIKVNPQHDRMILSWSKTGYNDDLSLVEVRSIKENRLITRYNFKKSVYWADLYNDALYYETTDKIRIRKKEKTTTFYNSKGFLSLLDIRKDKIFFIEVGDTLHHFNHHFVSINLKTGKKIFDIKNVIYFSRNADKLFYIKREPDVDPLFQTFQKVVYELNLLTLKSTPIILPEKLPHQDNDAFYFFLNDTLHIQSVEHQPNGCVMFFKLVTLFTKKNNGPKMKYIAVDNKKQKQYALGKTRRIETGSPKIQVITKIKAFKKYFSCF